MQDRQEHGPLDIELESPLYEQSPEDLGQAQLLPETLEDQYRPDANLLGRRDPPLSVCRQHGGVFRKAGARREQRIELTGFLQHIQSPQGGNHALLDPAIDPLVVHDLKILVGPGLLASYEHGDLHLPSLA